MPVSGPAGTPSILESVEAQTPLSSRQTLQIVNYVFLLLLLYNIAVTGIGGIAGQFILKETLRLTPQQLATFSFLSDIPNFIGFAFGFLRDRWRPFHQGDRGYFFLLPPLLAGANFLLAFGPFTYGRLLAAYLLIAALTAWLGAATRGLMTVIAQRHGMAGRFSMMLLLTPRLIGMASSAIGGRLATPAHQHQAFFISGLLCLPLMAMAFWKPRAAFFYEQGPEIQVVPEGVVDALKRLARHRVVYLPAIILFLWSFAPGWGTPLFFYLTNTVKLSEKVYGDCGTILDAGMLVATLLYGLLCYRARLRSMLWWGTLLGVLGCPIFLLIHSQMQAYVVHFFAGASLGIALCAYNDLIFRCCPKQLEGAALMFTGAMSFIAGDTSDIFGAWLYEKGGFMLALVVSTAFTAFIFFVLPFIPERLTVPSEGAPLTEN